jgi:hypothetical protein
VSGFEIITRTNGVTPKRSLGSDVDITETNGLTSKRSLGSAVDLKGSTFVFSEGGI